MKTNLSINIAKDEYGKDVVIDLGAIRHIVMAGATGSGKSVFLHNILGTLLSNNSPEFLKLILIDPKRVELTMYNRIPHLLTEVITDPKKAVLAMRWVVKEMNRRYDILKEGGVKDISEYTGKETMPEIVIMIDELSDLIQTYPLEVEDVVLKIAEMGHVVGVHIILSTSRPSTKVLTKSILDTIPARIAMQTSPLQDSKLIIGTDGAVKLHGAGDMLFRNGMKYIIRGQARLVTETDVKALCKSVCEKYTDVLEPVAISIFAFDDDLAAGEDELYEEAKKITMEAGKASAAFIQRKLGIGYSRAAGLVDKLEACGVVGPKDKKTLVRKVIKK